MMTHLHLRINDAISALFQSTGTERRLRDLSTKRSGGVVGGAFSFGPGDPALCAPFKLSPSIVGFE